MSIIEGRTEYKLKKPFVFAGKETKGKEIKCEFIELLEPTSVHTRQTLRLRQMAFKAMMDMASFAKQTADKEELEKHAQKESVLDKKEIADLDKKDEEEYQTETEKQVDFALVTMQQSDRIDLFEFVDTFREMACLRTDTPIAKCNGIEPMKDGIWEKVSIDDALGMSVWWVNFFATPSDRGLTG